MRESKRRKRRFTLGMRMAKVATLRCGQMQPARVSSAHVRLYTQRRRTYRMAMPAPHTQWTADMVRALPDDGNRYEVVDGELFVTPAPSLIHQRAVLELALLLAPYLREHRLGSVIIAPADVVFGPRNVV